MMKTLNMMFSLVLAAFAVATAFAAPTEATNAPPFVISEFRNMRDLGGWTGADGRKVKRGILFRSPALSKAHKKVENGVTNQVHVLKSEQQKAYCVDTLHIKTDLDLRFDKECAGMTSSPLGPTVEWRNIPVLPYKVHEKPNKDGSPLAYKRALDLVFDPAKQPVLIHCAIGADRTGCVCALALAVLGVSDEDIIRDYRTTPWLQKGSKKFDAFASRLREKYPAATQSESMVKYAKFLGYTDEDIAAIRNQMLE